MVLYVRKDLTDKLNLKDGANELLVLLNVGFLYMENSNGYFI